MVNSFVGGVRDPQGQRGFVEVAGSKIVAIDLAEGRVLWERERIGRLVAATSERLLTLDRAGEAFVLQLIDAVSGADAGRIENLGMPDWAAKSGLSPDAVQMQVAEIPEGIRLQWRLRRPYRGGAPPPAQISSEAQQEATGAIAVDLGTLRITPGVVTPAASTGEAVISEASSNPHVFALDRVGDRLFAIKTMDATSGVTLEARDAHDRTLLWEVPLTAHTVHSPGPLRK